MRKLFFTAVLAFLFVLPSFSKDLSFENTIRDAAENITEKIDGKVQTLAVLDIRSEYWALSDYIVSVLNDDFVNCLNKTNVAERDEYSLALIQQESDYQLSGAVSDETIAEIGAALGADCIVLGNMETVSGGWQLILRATSVESKKVLCSWRGKVSSKDSEVKFQVEKSKKSDRPKAESKKFNSANQTEPTSKNPFGLSISMINEEGREVTVLHPRDVIRFKVTSDKNAYLAILCIDVNGEEDWLPLENNYICAGESRIFPDIPGTVLRVEDGIFGDEQVVVYAASSERELPRQNSVMMVQGTRKLSLASGSTDAVSQTISYRVER